MLYFSGPMAEEQPVLHHSTGCSSRHKRQSLTRSDTAMLIYTCSSISKPIQPGVPSTKSHASFVSETGLTWLQPPEHLRCQADQCIMQKYMHTYFHIVGKKTLYMCKLANIYTAVVSVVAQFVYNNFFKLVVSERHILLMSIFKTVKFVHEVHKSFKQIVCNSSLFPEVCKWTATLDRISLS